VGLRGVSMGAYVSPQTVMATLQEVNKMKIDFNVPENLASKVRRGERVKVMSEAGDVQLSATVNAIEPQVNATSRNLKVRALIDGKTTLQAGMFVRVMLNTGGGDAMFVPSQAIVPDTRNKKVFLIKNGKAVSQIVETGLRQQDQVQIVSGAQLGDTIAISGILFLRPDAAVIVKKVM
jgi:membrane fusion protein, multidrug efflux system